MVLGKKFYVPPPFQVGTESSFEFLPTKAYEAFIELLEMLDEGGIGPFLQVKRKVDKYWQYEDFQYFWGEYLLKTENSETGITFCEERLKTNPQDYPARCILGSYYLDEDELPKAEDLLQEVWDQLDEAKPIKLFKNNFEHLCGVYLDYFLVKQDLENALLIYQWTLNDRWDELNFQVARIISRYYVLEELPKVNPDWKFDQLELEKDIHRILASIKVEEFPYNDFFNELLIIHLYEFGLEEVKNIEKNSTPKNLEHDVLWLLYQGIEDIPIGRYEVPITHGILLMDYYGISSALPIVFEILSLSERELDDYFEDSFIYLLPLSLHRMAKDHLALYEDYVRNKDVPVLYMSTILEIICYTGLKHPLLRNRVVTLLEELIIEANTSKDYERLSWIVFSIVHFQYAELRQHVVEVYSHGNLNSEIINEIPRFDQDIGDLDRFCEFETLEEYYAYLVPEYDSDTQEEEEFEEEEFWEEDIDLKDDPDASLMSSVIHNAMRKSFESEWDDYRDDYDFEDDEYLDIQETVHNPGEKVGRNDPCPCGSGKKYKRCCWRKN